MVDCRAGVAHGKGLALLSGRRRWCDCDAGTAIDHVEYSIAGGAFVPVSSIDGVADSREERYALTMPAGTDLTRVMLRATDVMQNVSTLSVGR
jgi:hypothetical protein